jgi:hypothetical protein
MASKRHIIMFGLGLQLAALAAQADIYRCEQDGRTLYTDHPCAGERIDPELASRAGAGDAANAASQSERGRRWEQESAVSQGQQRKADAEWLERHAQEKKVEAAYRRREVVAGMTQDQIRLILGTPDRIGKYADAKGQDDVWEYSDRGTGRSTVIFRDGRVLQYRNTGKRRH